MSHIALRQNQTLEKTLFVNEEEQDDIVQAKLDKIGAGINLRNILRNERFNDRMAFRQRFSDAADRVNDLGGSISKRLENERKPDLQNLSRLPPKQERKIIPVHPHFEEQPQREVNEPPLEQPALEPPLEQPPEPVAEPFPEPALEPAPEPFAEQLLEPVLEPAAEPRPEPHQISEEPLPENIHPMDAFAHDPHEAHQRSAVSPNQRPQGLPSPLSFSQQKSQQSAHPQTTQKTGNALLMAASESSKDKGSPISGSTQPFSQIKSNSGTPTYAQGQPAQAKTRNNSFGTLPPQNASSIEENSAKPAAQSMISKPQGQMDSPKAQALKINQQMPIAQKNGNSLQIHAAGYGGSGAGLSSSFMPSSSRAGGRPSLSGFSDKTASLQTSNDKNGKIAAPALITREPGKEKTASASPLPSHLSESGATELQPLPPLKELLSTSTPMVMHPSINLQSNFILSTPSSPQLIASPTMHAPARVSPPGMQDKAVSKDIKVVAAAPAPVLLSNSSAMNTVTTEKNEEDDEESEESTPLIRAVFFGSDEIIDSEMEDIIRGLKDNKVKLALLSQQEGHPLFDLCLQSSKVFVKPDWTAYREKIDLPVEEILFIDTNTARVQDAKIMGLNAITFTSIKQLKEELVKKKLL